ncbi:hypothetical protein [Isoptericola sp. G70]|uniref:hypothetical protein n=1 Tax=Isoptericola sp. G70 TaxID=3376633 RepID=UPI003A801577
MLLTTELSGPRPGLDGLDEVAALADEAVASGDTGPFYQALRASELPYLLKHYRDDPHGLLLATVTALHTIGARSPGLALGVSQHLSSMLAFGIGRSVLSGDDAAGKVVRGLLDETFDRRLLIANTTSQGGGSTIGASGSRIVDAGGAFRVDGHSTYMSLATEADKVVFLTYDAGRNPVGVVTDLRGNPALQVAGDLLFGDHLVLADTRRLTFAGLEVPPESVFGPDPTLNAFYSLQLMCHNLCVAALYLGGGHRILEETAQHGRSTTLPSGEPLSRSDSFAANVGRVAISYTNSLDLILAQAPTFRDLATADVLDAGGVARGLLRVSTAKYTVAKNVETIAAEGRKLIGARTFMQDHPVARIGAEVVFAALGPATEKLIERNFGTRYLEAEGGK